MGSLMVAIIQLLQNMVDRARRQGGQSIVVCILECLLFYIERIAKYFNKVSRMMTLLLGPFG
jgi:crotonobetainyl-CoA:carnitine CoA-transferase CaiB-like acyl-CoA transferase